MGQQSNSKGKRQDQAATGNKRLDQTFQWGGNETFLWRNRTVGTKGKRQNQDVKGIKRQDQAATGNKQLDQTLQWGNNQTF